MFRIAFMAEDRKLADVLRSVAGQVHNLEVVPVVIGDDKPKAAAEKPKRRKLVSTRNRARRDISPSAFGFTKGDVFSVKDLHPPLAKMGMSPKSAWYCILRMLKDKTAHRVGVGKYEATV